MGAHRTERLGSQFQQEITEIINKKLRNKHGELSTIISVTEADVAPDLKTAKIYVSIYDPDEEARARSFEILRDNAGFIRHELASSLHIRTVPELRFISDGSQEYGARIDEILKNLDYGDNEGK